MIKQIAFFKCEVQLTLETVDTKDAIEQLQFWNSIPEKCPVCESQLVFNHYVAQSFKFYGVRCMGEKERHQLNFHTYKDNKGFFIKDGEATDKSKWSKWSLRQSGEEEEALLNEPQRDAPRDRSGGAQEPRSESRPETDEDLQKTAQTLKASVKRETVDNQSVMRVGAFTVSLRAGKLVCDCRKFAKELTTRPDFECEHIRAARLWIADQSK